MVKNDLVVELLEFDYSSRLFDSLHCALAQSQSNEPLEMQSLADAGRHVASLRCARHRPHPPRSWRMWRKLQENTGDVHEQKKQLEKWRWHGISSVMLSEQYPKKQKKNINISCNSVVFAHQSHWIPKRLMNPNWKFGIRTKFQHHVLSVI